MYPFNNAFEEFLEKGSCYMKNIRKNAKLAKYYYCYIFTT